MLKKLKAKLQGSPEKLLKQQTNILKEITADPGLYELHV